MLRFIWYVVLPGMLIGALYELFRELFGDAEMGFALAVGIVSLLAIGLERLGKFLATVEAPRRRKPCGKLRVV